MSGIFTGESIIKSVSFIIRFLHIPILHISSRIIGYRITSPNGSWGQMAQMWKPASSELLSGFGEAVDMKQEYLDELVQISRNIHRRWNVGPGLSGGRLASPFQANSTEIFFIDPHPAYNVLDGSRF